LQKPHNHHQDKTHAKCCNDGRSHGTLQQKVNDECDAIAKNTKQAQRKTNDLRFENALLNCEDQGSGQCHRRKQMHDAKLERQLAAQWELVILWRNSLSLSFDLKNDTPCFNASLQLAFVLRYFLQSIREP
jgi:hypothetical protein